MVYLSWHRTMATFSLVHNSSSTETDFFYESEAFGGSKYVIRRYCSIYNRQRLQIQLRANVGIYRESQISSEKSNFGLYHPNNPLVWLFQKMILKNPQALCIWIILEKFENSQKNTIFIHEISQNFERFQRNSTGAKDLLLTSSSSHI